MKNKPLTLVAAITIAMVTMSLSSCSQKKNNPLKNTRWERISYGYVTGMTMKEVLTFEEDVLYYQIYSGTELLGQERHHYETDGFSYRTDNNTYTYSFSVDVIVDSINTNDQIFEKAGEIKAKRTSASCMEYRRDINYHP